MFVTGAGRGIGLTAAIMAPAARREVVVCDSTPGSTTVLMVRGAPQRRFYDRVGAGSAWPSRTREDSGRKRLTLGFPRIEVEYIETDDSAGRNCAHFKARYALRSSRFSVDPSDF